MIYQKFFPYLFVAYCLVCLTAPGYTALQPNTLEYAALAAQNKDTQDKDTSGDAQTIVLPSTANKQDFIDALRPKTRGLNPNNTPDHRGPDHRGIEVGQPTPDTEPAPEEPETAPPSVSIQIHFSFNSSELSEDSKLLLKELGRAMVSEELQPYRFLILGHTDSVGSDQVNLTLSNRRSQAVYGYLTENFEINLARLIHAGMGKYDILDPADPKGGINRRVEIMNIGKFSPPEDKRLDFNQAPHEKKEHEK